MNAITADASIGPTVNSTNPMIQGDANSQPSRFRLC